MKMNAETHPAVVRLVRKKVLDLLAIYVFGSWVQGIADAHSDLDLAVSEKTELDSARAALMQDIQNRGQVYAG